MKNIRAAFRFLLFILLTLVLVPIQMVFAILCGARNQQSPLVRLWYKGVLCILNISVDLQGDVRHAWKKQALFVSNHSSYLDIVVMGASMPPFFIAKADTADWPIFGFLIKIGGTLFISRKRSALPQQMRTIREALLQGKSLFLFPEGTTSDGTITLPFKSSLLNVLYDDLPPVHVAPVCINYMTIDGQPLSDANKDLAAWYGDMDFMPHLWTVFQQRGMHVKITLLDQLVSSDYVDAKKLTVELENQVASCFKRNVPATAGSHSG